MSGKLIFIGGTGRCGTTILSQMLGIGLDVVNLGETRYIVDNIMRMGKYSNPTSGLPIATDNFILDSCRQYAHIFFDIGNEMISIEQTPHSISIMPELVDVCDDMEVKFIHLVRDPVDVCASILTKTWGPRTVHEFCNWYNMFIDKVISGIINIHYEKYMQLNMMDIPERYADVCAFINCEYNLNSLSLFKTDKVHVGRGYRDLSAKDVCAIKELTDDKYTLLQAYNNIEEDG